MDTAHFHEFDRSPIQAPASAPCSPSTSRRSRPRPEPQALAAGMIGHLVTFARNEAEIVALELDAIAAGRSRDRAVRQQLTCRCAAMLDLWTATMRTRGCGDAWWVGHAAELAADAFWCRIRQLRAAAPGGSA